MLLSLADLKSLGKMKGLGDAGFPWIDDLNPPAINDFNSGVLACNRHERTPAGMHTDADGGTLHQGSPFRRKDCKGTTLAGGYRLESYRLPFFSCASFSMERATTAAQDSMNPWSPE